MVTQNQYSSRVHSSFYLGPSCPNHSLSALLPECLNLFEDVSAMRKRRNREREGDMMGKKGRRRKIGGETAILKSESSLTFLLPQIATSLTEVALRHLPGLTRVLLPDGSLTSTEWVLILWG